MKGAEPIMAETQSMEVVKQHMVEDKLHMEVGNPPMMLEMEIWVHQVMITIET